jgi:hypothetical protein
VHDSGREERAGKLGRKELARYYSPQEPIQIGDRNVGAWSSSRGVDTDDCRQKFRQPHPVQCGALEDERPKGGKHDRPATPGDTLLGHQDPSKKKVLYQEAMRST